ncbi:MAG: ABC transporter ATP-binding protein/permease [Anaeromicrobium sp.]|jgi:ATP-binding cassette subfamily B protein|uniref:ABC transporter ATP-binding protein n=1 Tax=Anaeromicrobium sp. TaxID=1929132 RepID=UPI0025F6F431|nr:ABC transporter ATP-binding protein [Anaeromicrobium sp.]MCT4596053.1 ABC transporter ATP-binding protein/permease [Anaeromicrobium sp.]
MYKIINRIIRWTGEYKLRLYKGFVYSFFNTIFTALPIMSAAFGLNLILADIRGEKELTPQWIWIMLAFLIFAVLGRFYTAYRRAVLQESITYEMTAKQRIHVGNILKRVPLGFFQKNNVGDLTSAVTNDLSYMEMYGMKMIDTVVNGYISAFTMVFCLCFYSLPLALVSATGIFLSALALNFLGKKSKKNAPIHLKAQENMIGATIEYIHGLPVVKAFGRQGVSIQNIKNAYEESKNINMRIEKQFVPLNCLHLLSLKVASAAIIMLASYFAMKGSMSVPNMVMMVIFSFVIFGHVEAINNATHVLEMIDNTMDKLEAIENEEFIDETGKDIKLSSYDIRFDKVTFSYDQREVLKGMSFTVPQNTTTAIIGSSGSGKTTICNLIARFYNPNSGTIFIGGKDICSTTCESLLKNISMVFQKVYLFHDTILNNIRFGNPNASIDDVVEVSKKACCHDFIMALPNGYDTIIGEGGSSLSGGEKQRISIARAILKDASIADLRTVKRNYYPRFKLPLKKCRKKS